MDMIKEMADLIRPFINKTSRRTKIITGSSLAVAIGVFLILRRRHKLSLEKDEEYIKKKLKGNEFFKQLRKLLSIVIPGFRTKEFVLLVMHTCVLISKTATQVYVAYLDGMIVKALVDRKGKEFIKRLIMWLLVAIPSTFLTSQIKYLENKLSIAFRTRLTKYAYHMYMKSQTYYRIGNLDGRLQNPDQCLTDDINKFCSYLAHVHSQLSKPILDIILNIWQLSRLAKQGGHGSGAPSALLAFVVIYGTAKILQYVRPKFGKLVAQQAELEGKLRFAHSRLINHSEEIGFLKGEEIEESILMTSYTNLVKHMNKIFKARIFYTMCEGYLMKYLWGALGVVLIAIPSFLYDKDRGDSGESIANRTGNYITAKNLMVNGADAIERIMLAWKEISQLAGYTSRVYKMIQVFKDVSEEKYQRQLIDNLEFDMSKRGKIIQVDDFIEFKNVPIISPNGDVLVRNVSFKIKKGDHLLISGPNGCGKSSLFRILGELWPVYDGILYKPPMNDLFYIPQRPYLSSGTLKEQIIYPDTLDDLKPNHEEELNDILDWVNLKHVLHREGGWDVKKEWKDVLSGGEKQRIGFARVFYHKPKFAILDECTSAVSIDSEGKMYQHAIDLGITLLTVSHRSSLWKYHTHILQFDGEGRVTFGPLNSEKRLSLKEEKQQLENQLSSVQKMQQRLKELCNLLGEDSVILDKSFNTSKSKKKKL